MTMKVLKVIALFVDWVIGAAAGVFALLLVLSSVFDVQWVQAPSEGAFLLRGWGLSIATLVGCGLLVLNLAVVFDVATRLFGAQYIKLPAANGRVNVSVKAVEDALERAVDHLDEVSGARVSLKAPGKPGRPVVIRAYVALKESVVYHSISRGIISAMESKFDDIVGTGTPVECHVYWEKIKHGSPRREGPQPAGPVDNLRPQFPVEREGQQ